MPPDAARDRPDSATSPAGPVRQRLAVITTTPVKLLAENEVLLRTRLQAVTIIFLLGFSLFFLRNLLGRTWFDASVSKLTWASHTFLLGFLGSSFALLAGDRKLTYDQLRRLEVWTFGLITGFLAILHYRTILRYSYSEEAIEVLALAKNLTLYSFMLMVIYGLFIPNTWQRAARVVAMLALTPVLVAIAVRVRHHDIYELAPQFLSFEMISDHTVIMLIGAGIALYGSYIINRLRTEVHEARQLGQYRLRQKLGSGGMGVVYLAEHLMLKRPCAIKLIAHGRTDEPRARARFEREVRATAKLSHPNTIEVYDYGHADDGTFFYVMEYLPGLDLGTLVDRHGPLPPARVIFLLRQACGALAEAHAAGLVHRDIKPANLYASTRGGQYDFTKVLDFGLVKAVEGPDSAVLTAEQAVVGSPQFMSPEQASGDEPDPRTDIYALGAVAYFLLTGRPPIEADSPLQVLVAHARDPIDLASIYRPDLPADLVAVVARCLARDPADRFPDAVTLDHALAACVDAGGWDADAAHRWWTLHEPEATARPGGLDPGDDTEVEPDQAPTVVLAGPAVAAVAAPGP